MECLFRVRTCCFCVPLHIRYGSMIIGVAFLIHAIVLVDRLSKGNKEDYKSILADPKIQAVWFFHMCVYGGQLVLSLMLLLGVARQVDLCVACWIFYMLLIAILEIASDLAFGIYFFKAELNSYGGHVLWLGIAIFCFRIYCVALVNTYYWRS